MRPRAFAARSKPPGSTYYPPRARWYGPLLSFHDTLHRRLALDRISLGAGVPPGLLLASFLLPGFACYLRWPKTGGKIVLAACPLLLVVFFLWLGYPAANLAMGLMLSTHVTGFVSLFEPRLAAEGFRFRIGFSLGVLVGMALLLYLPFRNLVQEHWLLPLRVHGRVVVVNRLASPRAVRRGDWIAYSITGYAEHQVVLEAGFGLGPVLAAGGDQVIISGTDFQVNGVARPLLPHMPHSGEFSVGPGQWFVWPDLDVSGHGNVAAANVSEALMGAALISQQNFLGKPFARWFWRRQTGQD